MDWIDILGFLAAILTGFILGAVGSGGSILAMPVLLFVFGVPATEATSYSLFIVGITAASGTIRAQRKSELSWPTVLRFGLPMLFAVILSRSVLLPSIPDAIFNIDRDRIITVLFALLMLGAAKALWSGRKSEKSGSRSPWLVILQGFATGILTGLVGAGGGFIIVPALILGLKLPMRLAVGTSLAIIAINSILGFSTDVIQAYIDIDWPLLLSFAGLSIVGLFIGSAVATKLPDRKVKKGFAVMVVLIAIALLVLK